jgi:hypothetical protein
MLLHFVLWGHVSSLMPWIYLIWKYNLCLYSGAATASEVPRLQLRRKNPTVVYWLQFVCDFVVSFTLPYLLEAGYANLQSKGRFIYGGFRPTFVCQTWLVAPWKNWRSCGQRKSLHVSSEVCLRLMFPLNLKLTS